MSALYEQSKPNAKHVLGVQECLWMVLKTIFEESLKAGRSISFFCEPSLSLNYLQDHQKCISCAVVVTEKIKVFSKRSSPFHFYA